MNQVQVNQVFLLLVLYQLKHFIADYPLQAAPYFLGKFRKGWDFAGPLRAHVGIHAAGTLGLALWWGVPLSLAVVLAYTDAAVHFVMDRTKASERWLGRWKALSANEMRNIWSYKDTTGLVQFASQIRGNMLFWWCLGFDQLVHHLTHYGCAWVLVTYRLAQP